MTKPIQSIAFDPELGTFFSHSFFGIANNSLDIQRPAIRTQRMIPVGKPITLSDRLGCQFNPELGLQLLGQSEMARLAYIAEPTPIRRTLLTGMVGVLGRHMWAYGNLPDPVYADLIKWGSIAPDVITADFLTTAAIVSPAIKSLCSLTKAPEEVVAGEISRNRGRVPSGVLLNGLQESEKVLKESEKHAESAKKGAMAGVFVALAGLGIEVGSWLYGVNNVTASLAIITAGGIIARSNADSVIRYLHEKDHQLNLQKQLQLLLTLH